VRTGHDGHLVLHVHSCPLSVGTHDARTLPAWGAIRIREALVAAPRHRDQCADGCPSAALLDEIARRPAATRQVFTDALMGVIDDIAAGLDPTRSRSSE
jgi:hypothetical protein